METIGQILKNAREKKGLTIEELEASTHIVARFIKALENEEFDVLPGEIYVKGFIKNLSDKLSLDANMVLERYNLQKNGIKSEQDLLKNTKSSKNVKKSKENTEQDNTKEKENQPPAKESLKDVINTEKNEEKTIKETNKRNKNMNSSNAEADLLFMAKRDLYKLRNRNRSIIPTIIIILAIIVVLAVIFVNRNNILGFFTSNKKQNRNETEISKNIVDSKARQSVKVGDVIYFKPLGISATIRFNTIGNVVHINVNGQDLSFSKSNPIILDLNGNGINDFKISVIEVYDNSATVEMERLEENQMVNTGYNTEIDQTELNSTNYNNTVSNESLAHN